MIDALCGEKSCSIFPVRRSEHRFDDDLSQHNTYNAAISLNRIMCDRIVSPLSQAMNWPLVGSIQIIDTD
ncbi:hypothetical protein CGZ80_24690 [Rhodopirellula sp. MGV]|nr:hypothetical protein CGZ80_24690 [Rhodopirellula sp. MGV]PNY35715.1 hypothetical protein C2E31_16645 [Rhodopirellula baltica]